MRGKLRILLMILSVTIIFLVVSPYQLAFVETDSMEPVIQPNDDLFVLDTSQDSIEQVSEDDVVTFYSQERDRLTTHRVIDKTSDGLITQGDSSLQTDQERGDPPVTDSTLEGKVINFRGSVLTIGNLAALSQIIVDYRFEIVVGLLFTLLIDLILPSGKSSRRNKTEITPRKIVFFVAIVLVLVWTGFVFISSTTIGLPNVIVEENPSANNDRFIQVGTVEERSQEYSVSRTPIPVHTKYDAISDKTEIEKIQKTGSESIKISYKIGPFEEQSVQSPRFIAYSYPQTLPSEYIGKLHSIHPLIASFGTVSVVSIPFVIVSLILFNSTKIRMSRYRWIKNRRGR